MIGAVFPGKCLSPAIRTAQEEAGLPPLHPIPKQGQEEGGA